MTKEQVNKLVSGEEFPEINCKPELIETHISWVIIGDKFVYKIKKPVHYPFLDFSTIEMRQYYCQREIELNKRLTDNIYIDVQPIFEWQNHIVIGGKKGSIIDHAVRMNKQDRDKQMDRLLLQNKVTNIDIKNLAEKIASFHKETGIIHKKDLMDIAQKFSDLGSEKEFLEEHIGTQAGNIISHAIETSDIFMKKNRELLAQRLLAGYFRDCHGDLHSRNIFLLPSPQPFDCIEFNDDFRQIDVLNEVAFLCMDLDVLGRKDLSDLFMEYYNEYFPTIKTASDYNLFIYYKSYRANIRAKVNSLRVKSAGDNKNNSKNLAEASKYLGLMDNYLRSLELPK